jgi:hypothetical protein
MEHELKADTITRAVHRPQLKTSERLDEIKWHLLRYDSLRVSLANRGALVLSANALIAAGVTVLAGLRTLNSDAAVRAAATVGTILTLLLVGISVSYATSAVANIRPWHKSYGKQLPLAVLYDASDTINGVKSL